MATAINSGYDKAFITILDANITTLIAGLILFQVGTGPIRGFAVTLTIGIFTTVFTTYTVTETIYELMFAQRGKMDTMSIGLKTSN